MAANCLVIAVHPSLPVRTLKELIAYAKANPGKLSYGHAGVGSIQHLTGELLKSLAETPDIVQVPYRGTGPAIADLVSGQVPMGIVGVTGPLLEFHRSGKTRILAVTNPTRLNVAPELPTAAELGIPGLTVTGTIGLLAPAGTPTGIIERIAQATRSAVAEPAYQQLLIDAGIEPTLELDPRQIPALASSRCRALDAGRQSARIEDRLSASRWEDAMRSRHGRAWIELSVSRHRHRHDDGAAGEAVRGIHPGRRHDRAALRRHRTGPRHHPQARPHDGRRRHGDERAGQRLSLHGAAAGRGRYLSKAELRSLSHGPCLYPAEADIRRPRRWSGCGKVEMWRGGCRPNISVCRLFRVAVP